MLNKSIMVTTFSMAYSLRVESVLSFETTNTLFKKNESLMHITYILKQESNMKLQEPSRHK